MLAIAAALRTAPNLESTLERVAESVSAILGYATAVVNLYRPAFDDFETVAVHGSEAARGELLWACEDAAVWARLIDERFQRRGTYFIPDGAFDWDADGTLTHVPEVEPSRAPDAWRPQDALFVPLRSSAGDTLGVLSVDEPVSGRRPGDRDLDLLVGVAAQAGMVIEAAQRAQASSRHRADVQELLRIASRLTSERSPAGIGAATCDGIRKALGFEKVVVILREEATGHYVGSASTGWESGAPAVECSEAELCGLLAAGAMQDGCLLLTREQAHATTPEHMHNLYSSQRNGRGPHGWSHHWLVVPLQGEDGRLIGALWADDPADRLLPTPERLRTLRAFANQAASALEAAATRERLRFLAEQDPLTGLRNRRHLHESIDAAIERAGEDGVSLVVADTDAFKRVNDELGSAVGDAVLQDLAGIITQALPPDGFGVRLGGEEFALVLPRSRAADARMIAEALRRSAAETERVPWGLTVSAGIAVTADGVEDGKALLRAATRALFVAKRLGRDRVVVYDPVTLESLVEKLDSEDGRGAHHLSAVLLLAEALDLRDAGTARHSLTVGRYAEQIARRLELHPDRVERVKIAGVVHDIGKLAVADAVLHKPGALDGAEWEEIRRHPEVGARILSHAGLGDVAAWVLAHHERWAGGGYPHGLAGADVPVEARILAVADAYEAMTASRPYRLAPLGAAAAQRELRTCAGTQFDPQVVEAFLAVLGQPDRPRPSDGGDQIVADLG